MVHAAVIEEQPGRRLGEAGTARDRRALRLARVPGDGPAMRSFTTLTVFAATLAGCGGNPRPDSLPPSVNTPPPDSAETSDAPQAPALTLSCNELAKRHTHSEEDPPRGSWEGFHFCFSNEKSLVGGWLSELRFQSEQNQTWTAKWHLVRDDGAGKPARQERAVSWSQLEGLRMQHASAFDFDGDGLLELLVLVTTSAHEAPWETFVGQVLTKNLDPYPGTPLLSGVKDVDGDGRPDLLYQQPYDHEADDVAGFGHRVSGPDLVAHSLDDGSFSTNDGVALAHAKKACPEPPARIVPEKPSDWSEEDIGHAIVCARLWGQSAIDVAQALKPCPLLGETDRTGGHECGDKNTWLKWARATPPVTLSE